MLQLLIKLLCLINSQLFSEILGVCVKVVEEGEMELEEFGLQLLEVVKGVDSQNQNSFFVDFICVSGIKYQRRFVVFRQKV